MAIFPSTSGRGGHSAWLGEPFIIVKPEGVVLVEGTTTAATFGVHTLNGITFRVD